jgi:hypothetical protein
VNALQSNAPGRSIVAKNLREQAAFGLLLIALIALIAVVTFCGIGPLRDTK